MSRLKNLFLGKSSSRTNLRGQAYDSTVARDPPLKGSYPVAGNGPNVLDEIHRAKAKRELRRHSEAPSQHSESQHSEAAEPPSIPRYREEAIQRPRTAPNDARGRGSTNGRTRSGFSMKSPPTILSENRRNSMRSIVEPLPPILPTSTRTHHTPRDIKTYQPKKGVETEQHHDGLVPSLTRDVRSDSLSSHRSHVDLLDAHSTIRSSRETSQHRAKASGVRNYGEDVANRNMNREREREPRLDLNLAEFSYLRHVYSPKKTSGVRGGHSRTSSALGHVLGPREMHDSGGSSDDMQPQHRHAKAASIRSGVTNPASRPPTTTASVPLSLSSVRESEIRDTLQQPGNYPDRGRRPVREPPVVVPEPTQSILSKGFRQSASVPRVATVPENSQTGLKDFKEPSRVPSLGDLPGSTLPHERRASNSSAKQRRRTMSAASQKSVSSNGHASKGSYSAFPSSSDRQSAKSTTSPIKRRAGMLVEERGEPVSLEGVVDLKNTVDTDVTTKILPAVTHEHVIPLQHEIREERITREIHTHDIYHRILPVIETEILPTKHYVPSDDGKSLVEIPQNELYKYTLHNVTGKPNGNWRISKDAVPRRQSITQSTHSQSNLDEHVGAEGPTIGLARKEPQANSRVSGSKSRSILEPILSSKKEYMASEGYSKTEYVWRHPPVFEDTYGRTQPVYIGAGIGDISSPVSGYYSDEDDAPFDAERNPNKGEEALLFRDSGYGAAGMLPGLSGQKAPAADYQDDEMDDDWNDRISYGKVLDHRDGMGTGEGEATKALRRMQKRRSSAASAANVRRGNGLDVGDVEKGMSALNVR